MRKWIKCLALTYAGYIALSIFVVFPALNLLVPKLVEENLGRELRSDIILFNPFALSVEIRNAQLLEQDGSIFLATDQARVNISTLSLIHEGLVFDEFLVESLYVHIRRLPSGVFNFADMFGAGEASEPGSSAAIPGLTIQRLSVQSEQIRFTDETRQKLFTTHWNGLAVLVRGLSTVREEGRPYSIDAVDESGGRLHWEGDISVAGAHSSGRLELENISLLPVWRYARQWLAFELKHGTLSVSGDYRLDWHGDLNYLVRGGALRLAELDVVPGDPMQLPQTSLAIASVDLVGIEVDGASEHLEVASISISGLGAQGYSERDEVSLAELFAMDLPAGNPATASDAGSSWSFAISRARLQDSYLRWRSGFTSPPVVNIAPINVDVSNLAWPPTADSAVNLELMVNATSRLNVNGNVGLESGDGKLAYALENLQLPLFNPNIPEEFNARITGGAVATRGEVFLTGWVPSRILMEGEATDFSGVIEDTNDGLTSWDGVRWQGLDVNLKQRHVLLQSLSLNGYSGRLHIYEDGTVNAQRVLQARVEQAVEEGTLREEELAAWSFDVPSVLITDSELNFTDESLPIRFQTVIGGLNGDVVGLSSKPEGETRVDLKGSVDGYAPVILKGVVRPFAVAPVVDMGLSFDGVDLVRLTPYSGTYAGYAIDRGVLNLDLHYSLEGSRLRGDNSVVIQQLRLGDRVDSDKAVDLPLDLALALLTDMNGVIDLDVPVSGDISDPAFSLGSVVSAAFFNLVSKAVTAPFTLLASLVGSDDDMQRVSFPSGSSQMDEAARAKLATLAEALAQRPTLTLVLYGRIHPTADREYLQKTLLDEQFRTAGLSAEDIASKSPAWTKAVEKRYLAIFSDGGESPDVPPLQQYRKVLAEVEVNNALLEKLAEERAVAVKQYLVNELQLAADRAAIEAVDLRGEGHVFGGVEFAVGT